MKMPEWGATRDAVVHSTASAIDGVNPFTFSDDRGKEARKALAAWSSHYSPDAALLIEHGGNWVEMAVLLTGSAMTLSHGFMASHP